MFTFESLGINIGFLVTIILVIEFIKKLDKGQKLKKFYVFFPLALSALLAGLTIEPFAIKGFLMSTLTYTGISSYGYKFVKANLNAIMEKSKAKHNQG